MMYVWVLMSCITQVVIVQPTTTVMKCYVTSVHGSEDKCRTAPVSMKSSENVFCVRHKVR